MARDAHQVERTRRARWREASQTPARSASWAWVGAVWTGEMMEAERRDISIIAFDVEESFTLWSWPENRFFICAIRTILLTPESRVACRRVDGVVETVE